MDYSIKTLQQNPELVVFRSLLGFAIGSLPGYDPLQSLAAIFRGLKRDALSHMTLRSVLHHLSRHGLIAAKLLVTA